MAAWNLDAITAKEEGFRDTCEANLFARLTSRFPFSRASTRLLVCAREQEVGTRTMCSKINDFHHVTCVVRAQA